MVIKTKMNMEELDWNEMWKELMQNASWSRRRRGSDMTNFWDKRARHYSESIKRNNHAERIIAKLDIDPECTVLDIGSGPGTLAIPLAKMVQHVTAIDPSSGMLACLKENAMSEGLKKNYMYKQEMGGCNLTIGTDIVEHDTVLASLITAGIICFTGIIGFIGLVAPHITRFVIGGDHRFLLPCSCIIGAILLVAADMAGRMILAPAVSPVGIVISYIGVPLFLYLLMRKRGEYWG